MKKLLLLMMMGIGAAYAGDTTKSVNDPPPDATLMVTQCDELVVMWVAYGGHIIRADPEHHPDTTQEYDAFLKWAQSGKTDLYKLPCKDGAKH